MKNKIVGAMRAMLLAKKNEELIRATPRNYGAICPQCEENVIPRCGPIKMWHWAHEVGECVYHTEPETEWHLEWKDRALKLGLEIEKRFGEHIADIYDPRTNTVTEVQHSPISKDDILNRCKYYSDNKMYIGWIFDRTKKYQDKKLNIQIFEELLEEQKWHNTEFKEKWLPKSFSCLISEDGSPNYNMSLHFKYYNNQPLLLDIFNLKQRKGHVRIFDNFLKGPAKCIDMVAAVPLPRNQTEKVAVIPISGIKKLFAVPRDKFVIEVGFVKVVPDYDHRLISDGTRRVLEINRDIYYGILRELDRLDIPTDEDFNCLKGLLIYIKGNIGETSHFVKIARNKENQINDTSNM